jgi:rhodanese-related sulfurtransferase
MNGSELKKIKIVIAGPFAAGKTEFIKTVSEIDPVTTERKITHSEEKEKKNTTTVAMDFGKIKIVKKSKKLRKPKEFKPNNIGDLIEIDTIPPNSIVIDVNRIHGKGRIKGLKDIDEIDKDKDIVLVCEEGEASYTMARLLRDKGFKAYSLHGGYRRLKELGFDID